MGGFSLVSPDGRLEVLSEERFYELLRSSQIDLPATTSEDIMDKSKSDVLVKMTAIGHVTWFLLRCVARRVQQLAITHLELLTFAVISFTSIFYTLVWLKPICVGEPVKVYLKSSTATVTSPDGRPVSVLTRPKITFNSTTPATIFRQRFHITRRQSLRIFEIGITHPPPAKHLESPSRSHYPSPSDLPATLYILPIHLFLVRLR